MKGHNSQPTTSETASPQGAVSRRSLITETTSPHTEPPKKASREPVVTSEPTTPRSSTMGDQSLSSLGQPQSQPQKLHTSGLDPSQNTPQTTAMSLKTGEYLTILPTPTSESVLTVAAFGVISFIVILVVVVIVLVSVVSLRFKCRKNKESEDPQKPGSSGISESCSTAKGEKNSITLISMKNINMNNSKGCSSAEKVL
ncbi:endothelial cell-specific chemotaxis regulator isoform X2 [Echinops telfairi]|uniref:Endothelial cell-specific chemotaxis regulator isoform X2 n=1 Tax=Echinops telfairi TaxID=9371 RepID=A0AC55CKF5_ECHTE|nr:endothelial cell-specific chemotaxis regulator isoform X2 [Echinops telfairi]